MLFLDVWWALARQIFYPIQHLVNSTPWTPEAVAWLREKLDEEERAARARK